MTTAAAPAAAEQQLPQTLPAYSSLIGRPIDNTALEAAKCLWRYWASMKEHRRRHGAPPPALGYGSAWHHVMKAHFMYVPRPEVLGDFAAVRTKGPLRDETWEDLYDMVEVYANRTWEDHQVPDDHRTLQRLLLDYRKFFKEFGFSWEEEGKTVGWPLAPMIEKAGEVAVPGARHPYAFKLDRVYRSQGQLFVDDHKTSAAKINFYEYNLSNQMMGYAVSAWILTGLVIAGVRIRGVIVHKGDTSFSSEVIPFGVDRLLSWIRNLDNRFGQLESAAERYAAILPLLAEASPTEADALIETAYPRDYTACAGRYGMCQYAGICSLVPDMRLQALAEDFPDQIPWNPLEADDDAAAV